MRCYGERGGEASDKPCSQSRDGSSIIIGGETQTLRSGSDFCLHERGPWIPQTRADQRKTRDKEGEKKSELSLLSRLCLYLSVSLHRARRHCEVCETEAFNDAEEQTHFPNVGHTVNMLMDKMRRIVVKL